MPEVTFTTGGALKKSSLRQANERLVLNVVRQYPLVSRADIVRITGLSPSSVTFIVQRLERQKMLCEAETEPRLTVGRQPIALRLRPQARLAVGVDVTLSGARIAVADMNDAIVMRKSVPWHANYALFFEKVNSTLRSILDAMAAGQALGVGVALPGFIDEASGRVLAAENFNWLGVDAGALLRRDLPVPFYFENTARLSAMAEMWSSERGPRRCATSSPSPRTEASEPASSSTASYFVARPPPVRSSVTFRSIRWTPLHLRQHRLLGAIRLRPRACARLSR